MAGLNQRGQMLSPFDEQPIAIGLRHNQDIGSLGLVELSRCQHLEPGSGVSGGRTHAPQSGQISLHLGHPRLGGHHHRSLGQISMARKWKPAVAKHRQVGHGNVVAVARQVDVGIGINRRMQQCGLNGIAFSDVGLRNLERQLQAVIAWKKSRHLQIGFGLRLAIGEQGHQQ